MLVFKSNLLKGIINKKRSFGTHKNKKPLSGLPEKGFVAKIITADYMPAISETYSEG